MLLSPLGGEIARAAIPALKSPGKTAVKVGKALGQLSGVAAAREAVKSARAAVAKGPTVQQAGSKIAAAARGLLSTAAGGGVSGGVYAAGAASAVAAAGLISYWITKKILEIPAKRREDRAAKAAAAATAYRQARLDAASQLGRALTQVEQQQLAAAFKAELSKLGLSSSDLAKL